MRRFFFAVFFLAASTEATFDSFGSFNLDSAVLSLKRFVRQADDVDIDGSGSGQANVTDEGELWGTCQFVETCWQSCDANIPDLVKGEPGPQGPNGTTGIEGYMGPRGEKGEQGEKGVDGEQGETGEKGPTGAKGEKGRQGEKGGPGDDAFGENGDKGDPGPQGEQGEPGRQGCKGEKGQVGPVGEKGDRGPQGSPGQAGSPGETGVKGELGPVGPPGQQPGVEGPTGAKGVKGMKGILGSTGGVGEKGDIGRPGRPGSRIIINVTMIDLKKWSSKGSKLEKGKTGEKGAIGNCDVVDKLSECLVEGPKGYKGETGPAGPKGPSGFPGPRGPKGDEIKCSGQGRLKFIKGDFGRPASRPPMVRGLKGDPGENRSCTCDDIQCPINVTIPCSPKTVTTICQYKIEFPEARPGPRGSKGDQGDSGAPGTEAGPSGPPGEKGPQGECKRCSEKKEEDIVMNSPSIYVLHESTTSRFRRQTATSKCAGTSHQLLWEGYSLFAATVNKNSSSYHDLGGTGSCLPLEQLPQKALISFSNAVEIANKLQMRAQLDRSTTQEAFWLGSADQAQKCAVCKSNGPVSVFHGLNECPPAEKRQMKWAQLWRGKSLSVGNIDRQSTASCQNQFNVIQKNACPNGQNCDDTMNSKKIEPKFHSTCVVCALEPLEEAKTKFQLEGQQFVQHSQEGSFVSPGCKAGHIQLYDGFSLMSSNEDGGQTLSCSPSFVPLVTGSDCVKSSQSGDWRLCKPKIEDSTWMLSSDYVPASVNKAIYSQIHTSGRSRSRSTRRINRVSPSHLGILLTRLHDNTDLPYFQRSFVSRCSVCMSRGPIYVQHGLEAEEGDTANLTCRQGFSKLWHGYSFVMATVGQKVIVKDLSSPESCLRTFEPIMALDCPASHNSTRLLAIPEKSDERSIANICKFPFSTNRFPTLANINLTTSHWLASINGHVALANSQKSLSFGERYAQLVSRCVVCELNSS